MVHATFTTPDLTQFGGIDGLGLRVVGQRLDEHRAVRVCQVVEADDWCRRCGCQESPRDSATREFSHESFGWRPTTLLARIRRHKCAGCGYVWRKDTSAAAHPRARIPGPGRAGPGRVAWALVAIMWQHSSIAFVAEGLAVARNTANDAVLAEGQARLVADPTVSTGSLSWTYSTEGRDAPMRTVVFWTMHRRMLPDRCDPRCTEPSRQSTLRRRITRATNRTERESRAISGLDAIAN